MNQLTTFLILVLASTNASKYFRPQHQYQQEPATRNRFSEMPYLPIALDEDRFFPVEEGSEWESPPDPRIFVNDLESLGNFLPDDPNDFRMKRTKTSLSIDNPLDVLRQQYFRSLARRMKYKSIEKNREHLLKTGKRSEKDIQFSVNLTKQTDFPSRSTSKEFTESGLNSGSQRNEPNPTARRYPNRLDDSTYQT